MDNEEKSISYKKIGCAIAFSPRLDAVIAESSELAKKFNAELLLIHVGEKTEEKETILNRSIKKSKAVPKEILWLDGHPVNSILETCEQQKVELLVLGAIKKESLLKYYIGSVGRNICRKANCSVLMLTKPQKKGSIFKNIVVNIKDSLKTITTLNIAMQMAEFYNVEKVKLVVEQNTKAMVYNAIDFNEEELRKMKHELLNQEDHNIKQLLEQVPKASMAEPLEFIHGKPGYAVKKYAKAKKADLLIINAPEEHLNILDRIFTNDIEYLLENTPCNLLIVHSEN